MAGAALNKYLTDTIGGAIDAFQKGGFGGPDGNTWIPDLNVKPEPTTTWYPGIGNEQVRVTPTNVRGPFDYMNQPTGILMDKQLTEGQLSYPYGSDEQMARKYQQQRELAGVRELGVSNEQFRDSPLYSPTTDTGPSGRSGGGTAVASAVPSAPVLRPRIFTQRTPSGTVYAPDLSAYNASSLFDYAGPGGLAEYTYGQGLRTDGADYSIWGSPTDIANPYFAGQFKEPQGPADAAINMPAVELPEGVQPVNPPIVGGLLPGGITPRPPSVGTVFPSPGVGPTLTERMLQDAPLTGVLMDRQLRESQLGNVPQSYGLTWPRGDNLLNNEIPGRPGELSAFSENDLGMVNARRNYLFNRDLDLGRPGDASYEEFVANPSLFTTYVDSVNPNEETLQAGLPTPPTDMQRYLDDFEARGIRDRTAEILAFAEQNDGEIDGVEIENIDQAAEFERNLTDAQVEDLNARGLNIQKTEDEIFGARRHGLLDYRNPEYSISGDAFTIPWFPVENQPNVLRSGEIDTLANRAQRSLFKPDEIDIPTPPWKPEGVEGEDYYRDIVTGEFYDIEDDLGLNPLGPNNRGSRRNETLFSEGPSVRGSRRNPTLFSDGPNVRGTRGDTVPADIPDFLDYNISRMNDKKAIENAVDARDAQLQEQLDSRPAYERAGTEEFTSNRLAYLDNAYDAIDAKYEGSETDASQQAKLVEVLNANLDSFGNAAGRENAALAREQLDIRQAGATPFVPSYAREIEGTDMGESLFQGVDPVVTGTVYPGENRIPFNPSNPIDQLVLQKTAQEAQVARAKYDNVPARAETGGTPISIFNVPAREPVSMNQVIPMVARTENNMTVPVMRDSALDRRYGGPMRFGR